MIPDKVKALFQFIEYLHSNIENFNKHNDLIKELEQLDKEKKQLKPRNNYKDKQQYDKVQVEIKKKFNLLQTNTASLIKAKATELNVCSFENEPNYSFNGVEAEILQLKDNFSNEDLPEIFKHKSKYLEYRTKTHKSFWSLEMFFVDLDRLLKEFFDFFADSETETDVLKETVVKVENFKELALYVSKGVTLTDFINENKKKALAIDLKSYGALGYQTLQKQKLNPDKEFIQGAIAELKNNLTNYLVNNNHISDKSETPIYLRDIRLYLEYSNLLDQPQQPTTGQEQQTEKPKPELKIDQIALKYAYEGLQITRENGNEIAKKYGHNSGEKLFQRFTYFSSPANRKGKPNLCTPKKLDNKIKLIESIIELLPTDKQERAKDEVSILKKIYEAEYQ